ncbi:uncharacterized protein LOC125427888 [Sphaerodactylus townsendi]|uniref:uncharacterized protein LOC125427888 n=1 Tax=Sphaerodactylus townsendi TaxID=933632 RepID=UPI002025D2FD|nr:uncharacterized protein LOC125427888 [Sphaerodactylus townsendi]
MSKRKKTQLSEENQELNIPKAKKTHKRKTQGTRARDQEKPGEASDSSSNCSKATVPEAVLECKDHHLNNKEKEILAADMDTSSAEENKNVSAAIKICAKTLMPPSQDALESTEAECVVSNVPCDTAGKAFQSTVAPSELMNLSVSNKEDLGDQGILHCQETQDVKIQNQDRTVSIKNGDVVPGSIDFQLKEAQNPNDIPANISEKQKTKSKKKVSFLLCTSDSKDAQSLEEREPSAGSLDHLQSNQNTEALEGPILQTKQGSQNRCEKLGPITKQSKFDMCDVRANEGRKALSKGDTDQQNLTQIPEVEIRTENSPSSLFQVGEKEGKTVMGGENKLVCVEGCLSPAEVTPQLEGALVKSDSSRENLGSKAQGSFLSTGSGSSISAQNNLDAVTQAGSPLEDPLSVDLEYMLDSQLHSPFESNNLEHLHKSLSPDDSCAASGTKSVANVAPPNNARDEMIARVCDPAGEEDATDVVRGLIKELSNLKGGPAPPAGGVDPAPPGIGITSLELEGRSSSAMAGVLHDGGKLLARPALLVGLTPVEVELKSLLIMYGFAGCLLGPHTRPFLRRGDLVGAQWLPLGLAVEQGVFSLTRGLHRLCWLCWRCLAPMRLGAPTHKRGALDYCPPQPPC